MKVQRFIYVLCLFLTTCIDPFDIGDVVEGQRNLVVDGLITNQQKAHEIRITYSSPNLQVFEDEEVIGANVYIEDEEGNRTLLSEVEAGLYQTPADFAGTVGMAYTLNIRTAEDKSYRSLPEMMQPVAEIDSIYARLESRPYLTSIGSLLDEWGMQLYVSTGTGLPEANFYRWNWVETYEFIAPLIAPMQLNVPVCFQSGRLYRQLLIGSSQDLTKDRIERQPMTFVSKRGRKLQIRYSLLVEQYSLTERAFTFWENVQEQQNSDGSVFDPPPARIIGNMRSVDNPDETVLGYFQVSAVTEKRVFIGRGEVPSSPGGPVTGGFESCNSADPEPYCYDCSLLPGTTTERPPFW
uniref:DUF4249 domain-containing protein n=1 Tax=Roseihalotalea indica TaxID=2867963 RepID=A0AA49GRT2_9BACT|nr:DUF4249 domain-containing protein [Tunicatimonas sp. TK19036]